jgi:hypothetical protein
MTNSPKGLGRWKVTWKKGRRELSHRFSEILYKDKRLSRSPDCWKQWDKSHGNNLCSVGLVVEIICVEIALKEVIK